MAEPMHKVSPGDPLNISAETFNTFIDVAEAFNRGRINTQAGRPQSPNDAIVFVRNDSGDDVDRFGILAITGVLVSHEDNEDEFVTRPSFSGDAPAADTDPFTVTIEPIADGDIGRARIYGATPVQIDVVSEGDEYATPASADVEKLVSGSSGPARIIWKESGTGTKWAVVQFPFGGGSTATVLYAKIVSHAGTEPPYTYTAYLCTHDGSSSYAPENFTEGSLISAALVNLAEVGPDGTGVGPLEPDTIVQITSLGSGKYACESWANCGTY